MHIRCNCPHARLLCKAYICLALTHKGDVIFAIGSILSQSSNQDVFVLFLVFLKVDLKSSLIIVDVHVLYRQFKSN